ncbi:DUF1206 domain-containing protein [Microbacterium sp. NPDC091313]
MSSTRSAARAAQDSTAFEGVARVGYVVLGILHIVLGSIAISIATGGGGQADQGGAVQQIQQAPWGLALLWATVIGLAALTVWQIAEAVLARDADAKKRWGHRIKDLGTALAYVAVALTALTAALGGRSDSEGSTRSFSAQLLASPGGVFVLVLLGLVVAAVGIAFVVRGATRAFARKLSLPSGPARTGILAFGAVGYIAKGVAVAVTGVLFVIAAFAHDPSQAGGLDAGLHALAALPFGVFLLWLVGAGLVVYGLFCFARARHARM